MPEDHDFDRLIDAALATYAEPRPESGSDSDLPARILNRIASQPRPQPRLRWLPWAAIALPAAICLLLFVHSGPRITKPRVRLPDQTAQFHNPAIMAARPHLRSAPQPQTVQQINRPAPHSRLFAATQPLPELDVFPTPQPLTSQERALAVYVEHTPQPEQQALARSEQEPIPLTVASIHVMPLEPPDEGTNPN